MGESEKNADSTSLSAASVLFAGKIAQFAFDPVFDGKCAFARSAEAALAFPAVKSLTVLMPHHASPFIPQIEKELSSLPLSGARLSKFYPDDVDGASENWTEALLCAALAKAAPEARHIYFLWADTPFVDVSLAASLFERHIEYSPEYTFADCYPAGLAPEILASGILPVIEDMAKDLKGFPARDTLFNAIKKDINSFDIETDIADEDARMLRVTLACDTLRNREACEGLKGISAKNYATVIRERQWALRTRPAFYAFQISGRCPFECAFCPCPRVSSSNAGRASKASAVSGSGFMELKQFKAALEKIAAFSDDAVISLSLWGECAFHPDAASFAEEALKYPKFSLLIETTGIGWQRDALERIRAAAKAAESAPEFFMRPAGAVNWIVSLDAVSAKTYGALRGLNEEEGARLFEEASSLVSWLKENFGGRVYPQFLRMRKNEAELEEFYRYWKEKNGDVIVQKYDHFCGLLPDERPADLSPLERVACWHLKRDVSVLIDGSVPFCREDIAGENVIGNIFYDSLPDIFAGNKGLYEKHIKADHGGHCGKCDEYYTFNF